MAADTYKDHPGRAVPSKMYRVWSEWDIGHERKVFTSEAKATAWCENNTRLLDIVGQDDAFSSVADIFDQGLVGVEPLEMDVE